MSTGKPASYSYLFGAFRLSIAEKKLYFEGHHIQLSTTQFDTLRLLAEQAVKPVKHQGENIVKKEDLARRICGKHDPDLGTVEKAIYDLRARLHDSEKRLIKTERGGYCIGVPVRGVPDEGLEDRPAEIRQPQTEGESKATRLDAEEAPPEGSGDGTIPFRELWRGPSVVVRWILMLGVGFTIVTSVALLFDPATRRWARLFVSVMQACVLSAAVVGARGRPRGFSRIKDDSYKIAENASERAIKYWRYILVTWVLLYLVLAFQVHPYIEPPPGKMASDFPAWKVFSVVSDLINIFNTLLVILCYDVLRTPLEIRKVKSTIADSRLFIGLVFIFIILALEIFSVMGSSQQNLEAVLTAWSLGTGILAGIAVALFIGRLQSMFLGPPRSLIIALYSYIALQPLYVHFGGHQTDAQICSAVILINAALILKCLLYFYLALLFKSGRLLFYLVWVRRTYQKVGTEWPKFQQDLDEDA